jgi:acyl carrier protein
VRESREYDPLPWPDDQETPTRAGVFEIVRASLADILEIEASTISEGQSFVDDLEADSLALIELVEALEEEFADRPGSGSRTRTSRT